MTAPDNFYIYMLHLRNTVKALDDCKVYGTKECNKIIDNDLLLQKELSRLNN